jgi:hypothetical protein
MCMLESVVNINLERSLSCSRFDAIQIELKASIADNYVFKMHPISSECRRGLSLESTRNFKQALGFYTTGAYSKQRCPVCMFALGRCCFGGLGIVTDKNRGINLIELTYVDFGFYPMLSFFGDRYKERSNWLQKSAYDGLLYSQAYLAIYEDKGGRKAVKRNLYWARKAAKLGDCRAHFHILWRSYMDRPERTTRMMMIERFADLLKDHAPSLLDTALGMRQTSKRWARLRNYAVYEILRGHLREMIVLDEEVDMFVLSILACQNILKGGPVVRNILPGPDLDAKDMSEQLRLYIDGEDVLRYSSSYTGRYMLLADGVAGTEESFFISLCYHYSPRCQGCDSPAYTTKLRACSKCMRSRYCGKECQRACWPVHRHECEHITE